MELAERQEKDLRKEDRPSRAQLITEYLPYVKSIVQRMAMHLPPNVEIDDLINAGIIGLIEAVDNYDPGRDNKFITYAMFRIRGAVLGELRSNDFHSRQNRRKIRELERAYLKLEQKLGREVKDEEVAKELGLNLDQFYQTKKMASISFISLEEIGDASKEEKERLATYLNSDTEDALDLIGLREIEDAVAGAIEQLPEKEKLVISLYYREELTMKEIGKILDITESRVSQIHSQAVIHLRAKLRKEGLIED
ncbi:MAG TPA: FliA/WhiG family RNA polymerase sigma factor [Desulfobacteraceae bacterium]|nr:FliA/WhiG family RNA polymerase sigma factor [Desulfobacteraceae bacterium]